MMLPGKFLAVLVMFEACTQSFSFSFDKVTIVKYRRRQHNVEATMQK